MKKKPRKKASWKRVCLIVVCVVLSLVLAVLVVGSVWLDSMLRSIPRVQEADNTPMTPEQIQQSIQEATDPIEPDSTAPEATAPELPPEDIVWEVSPPPQIGKEDEIINILLIGQDRRPGEGRQRSDAMILCTINLDQKKLIMTSFLRDTYVQYPDGYIDHKLNSAYQWGGMSLLNATLELNYGIHVDGNVEVDFDKFKQLVDLMGGVDIALSEAEAGVLSAGNRPDIGPGYQRLNGEQALIYARIRKLDSDFGRTNRQRTVLKSMLQSCKGSSVSTLMELLKSALNLVTTDMSDRQIMRLATEVLPMLKDLEVTTQYIPAEGTYTHARVNGMSVLLPDLEANRKILLDTLK